ncbi:hypothetical protein [Bifidobacterium tissieri]|nr:hypothetical protein [Bifidobacterium tissieri]
MMTRSTPSPIRTMAVIAAALAFMMPLTGCGDSGAGSASPSASEPSSSSTTSSRSTNVAWSHINGTDVQTAYAAYTQNATLGDHARQVLGERVASTPNIDKTYVDSVTADGTITADEMNDAEQRAVDCFAGHDMTAGKDYWFGLDSGLVTDASKNTPAEDNAISTACMDTNGYNALRATYLDAVRNPDGVDLEPYRFQCYKDYKLIDTSVSYDEYTKDQDSGKSLLNAVDPATPSYRDYVECFTDPLHHMTSDPSAAPTVQ